MVPVDARNETEAELGCGLTSFGGQGLMDVVRGSFGGGCRGERAWRTGVRWRFGPDRCVALQTTRPKAANDDHDE